MNETILIVDDNYENLEVLRKLLNGAGYAVHPATQGRTAIRALEHLRVDLILLDIRMPGMDGYQVCRELKGNPATAAIPVIFISALHEPVDKVKAFSVGGVDYVTKPFDRGEILARVSTQLQLLHLQRLQQRYTEELEQEVVRKTAALREANAGLQEALQAKDEFLKLINHELRTPLNGILGMVNLLRAGSAAKRQEGFLKTLESSSWRLLRLLENLIQLTAQGVTLTAPEKSAKTIEVEAFCRASLEAALAAAKAKNLVLHLGIQSPARLVLPMEAARLRQVLDNLLDNAVKFSPEHGKIGLNVKYDPGGRRLYLDVWDSGCGIPRELRSQIFEPFVQLEPVLIRRHQGAGLGLASARNLLRLHRGQIDVLDRQGKGAVFRVQFGVKVAEGEAQDIHRAEAEWPEAAPPPAA